MSCALPCTWWCCTIEPVWAPPQKLRTKSLSYVCSGLFCKPILCFVLGCGVRVASKSNVDSIPSLNGVLILRCEYQSFMIIEIVMSILFNRRVSLQVDPIISTSARSSISSSQRCLFHPSPSCLCFSRPPTLFLQGFRFLNQVSFYWWQASPFFSINALIRWFSERF